MKPSPMWLTMLGLDKVLTPELMNDAKRFADMVIAIDQRTQRIERQLVIISERIGLAVPVGNGADGPGESAAPGGAIDLTRRIAHATNRPTGTGGG